MKVNKRWLAEAIVAALLAIVLLIGGSIVSGMYLTTQHVPDIMESYSNNVYTLQSQVSFGVISPGKGTTTLLGVGVFLFVVGVYYVVRVGVNRRVRK
ncbi:hypothetical protein JCM10914A_51200 [Paenibacillus sp. JCM 10914]|uniref:hypothetical protein n=1 Tax=Paenibacillus sp. JCM 10914 TaxID=1236974 RepID=UPI0003CCA629|nr:hypothetical protein [Paenibacillus sp. JCM 10914]GAE05182.1 hypothetical protein JCM10914_1273 [Paenibacillus sp. JCM 10914]